MNIQLLLNSRFCKKGSSLSIDKVTTYGKSELLGDSYTNGFKTRYFSNRSVTSAIISSHVHFSCMSSDSWTR